MRPRFSLKWLLIAFTVLSVLFYVLFIRPTVNAERFVADINAGNYSQLPVFKNTIRILDADAFLLPRSWDDALRCRWRIGVEVTSQSFFLVRSRDAVNTKSILYESGPLGMCQHAPTAKGRSFRRPPARPPPIDI